MSYTTKAVEDVRDIVVVEERKDANAGKNVSFYRRATKRDRKISLPSISARAIYYRQRGTPSRACSPRNTSYFVSG